eukprot:1160727-Pelagomonas_calceolata.AAC.13
MAGAPAPVSGGVKAAFQSGSSQLQKSQTLSLLQRHEKHEDLHFIPLQQLPHTFGECFPPETVHGLSRARHGCACVKDTSAEPAAPGACALQLPPSQTPAQVHHMSAAARNSLRFRNHEIVARMLTSGGTGAPPPLHSHRAQSWGLCHLPQLHPSRSSSTAAGEESRCL